MRIFFALIAVAMMTLPARADDTETLCRFQVSHRAGDDVAYRPGGVNSRGGLIVPADLDAPLPAPAVIGVPLTVDLAAHINQQLPDGMELDAPFGIIDVHSDGRIVYNGRDLTEAMAVLCAEGEVEATEAGEEEPEISIQSQPEPQPGPPAAKPKNEDVIWGEGY